MLLRPLRIALRLTVFGLALGVLPAETPQSQVATNSSYTLVLDATSAGGASLFSGGGAIESRGGTLGLVFAGEMQNSELRHVAGFWAVVPSRRLPLDLIVEDPSGDVVLDCSRQTLRITTRIVNSTDDDIEFQLWTVGTQTLGGNFQRVVKGPYRLTAPAGGITTRRINQRVPRNNRGDRAFDYAIYIGDFRGGDPVAGDGAVDSSTFNIAQVCASGVQADGVHEPLAEMIESSSDPSSERGYYPPKAAPNPSRRATTLTFELEAAEAVRISLYDGLGRFVMDIVDTLLPAGQHQALIDTGRLPSGVYTWRFTAGSRLAEGRLTVLR